MSINLIPDFSEQSLESWTKLISSCGTPGAPPPPLLYYIQSLGLVDNEIESQVCFFIRFDKVFNRKFHFIYILDE